ncbi:unnamed protein product [Urochloa humidicola]
MAGHGDDGSNLFQGADDFFSQSEAAYPAYSLDHASRQGIQGLDLNSQADEVPNPVEFANIGEYSAFLASQSTRRSLGFRPPRHGSVAGGSGQAMSTPMPPPRRPGPIAGMRRRGPGKEKAVEDGARGSRAGGGRTTRRARLAQNPTVQEDSTNLDPHEAEQGHGEAANVPFEKDKPSEWRKLEFGNPEYIDLMKIMFKDVVVDGSTSYVPGQEDPEEKEEEEEEEEEKEEQEEEETTPKSSSTRKRSNSSTCTSPSKKTKSPMVRVIKDLVTTWNSQDEANQKAMIEAQQQIAEKKIEAQKQVAEQRIGASRDKVMLEDRFVAESVKRCQDLALECGVSPESVEFYACRNICKDPYDRAWFCNLPTPQARLQFLQRYCQHNNLY